MDRLYITVTLEISGYDATALQLYHADLQERLRRWHPCLSYGEVTIAYQDQAQLDADAQGEADTASDAEAWPEE